MGLLFFHHAESYALSGLLPFLNKTLHFPEFGNKVEGKLTCKTLPEAQRTQGIEFITQIIFMTKINLMSS